MTAPTTTPPGVDGRPSRFERDTAVVARGGGRYGLEVDRGWWIERGPNGGYVAALAVRAALAELRDPARQPRSLTVHYLAPLKAGPAEALVTVERAGRNLSTLAVRLVQDGTTCALALLACSNRREAPEFCDLRFPYPRPPEALVAVPRPSMVPMHDKYETHQLLGPGPLEAGPVAEVGGWIRLADTTAIDPVVVAALTDAWLPAIFSRVTEQLGVPTVDLTVHFRNPVPADLAPDAWCFVQFRSSVSADGFLEEDGEVWSSDGTLLAQSRQLAVVVRAGGPTAPIA